MKNIAVLVSGGGTNLQALIDAEAAGKIENGKAVFTGLAEGATPASIKASNGETHSFNITVRKSANGSGWL